MKDWDAIARKNGFRAATLPVSRLKDVARRIRDFAQQNELNGFQNWIVNEMYQFTPPDEACQSVLIVAVPFALWANVRFALDGRTYELRCPVSADMAKARRMAEENASHIWDAGALPFKRIAVHSGLAKYGRNNVTYVDGLGSAVSYWCWYLDEPCADSWTDNILAPACSGCGKCIQACPTGAIRPDRFLIDNLRCLSCHNESPAPLPDWLPANVHHTLYDCLRCQENCPMNCGILVEDGGEFTEEETQKLLSGDDIDTFPEPTQARLRHLGIDQWYAAIPRNLQLLIAQKKKGGESA